MVAWLETFFKVKENNSTVKREIYAGLLTFLATSYILAVNPAILENAYMDRGGVLCATAIAAFIGTACPCSPVCPLWLLGSGSSAISHHFYSPFSHPMSRIRSVNQVST